MNATPLSFIGASVLLLAMGSAFAAPPTSDLKVTGKLVVPVCTVASGNDGIYDLGKIPATMIKPTANTELASLTNTWTISCDAETYLNFSHTDNRVGTVSTVSSTGGTNFGLGNVNGTGKIGFYKVAMDNANVDGVNTALFHSQKGSIIPENVSNKRSMYDGWVLGWAASSTTQKSGKVFAADLTVTPTLASSQIMNGPIADDANIDGSLTLTFAFGI